MTDEKKPIDPAKVRFVEMVTRELGRSLQESINGTRTPSEWGFVFIVFNFNGAELAYVSNANRADVVRMLEEMASKLRTTEPGTQAERN